MVFPRLQSAMEYLMTYGWAVLIIAIILVMLYFLGVFNLGTQTTTVCQSVPGYSCQGLTLNRSGYLSFELTQNTGSVFHNMQIACSSSQGSSGPYIDGINPFQYVDSGNGNRAQPNAPSADNVLGMSSGASAFIGNIVCYNINGAATNVNPQAIGAVYTGSIFINYTIAGGAPSQTTNPWQTAKVATISVKIT